MITTVARRLFYLNSQRYYEKSCVAFIANGRIDIQLHLSDEYLVRVRKMTFDIKEMISTRSHLVYLLTDIVNHDTTRVNK